MHDIMNIKSTEVSQYRSNQKRMARPKCLEQPNAIFTCLRKSLLTLNDINYKRNRRKKIS